MHIVWVRWFCFSICFGLIKVSCLCDEELWLWKLPVRLNDYFSRLHDTIVNWWLAVSSDHQRHFVHCQQEIKWSLFLHQVSSWEVLAAPTILYIHSSVIMRITFKYLCSGSKLHRLPREEIWKCWKFAEKLKMFQLNGWITTVQNY